MEQEFLAKIQKARKLKKIHHISRGIVQLPLRRTLFYSLVYSSEIRFLSLIMQKEHDFMRKNGLFFFVRQSFFPFFEGQLPP